MRTAALILLIVLVDRLFLGGAVVRAVYEAAAVVLTPVVDFLGALVATLVT